jgi:hypothetical protein
MPLAVAVVVTITRLVAILRAVAIGSAIALFTPQFLFSQIAFAGDSLLLVKALFTLREPMFLPSSIPTVIVPAVVGKRSGRSRNC